ncbi:hypothetical protein BT93_H3661 [Corymbia citriodora subsp. variegata]|nr:hypothetical protein BT93_H3661 [Corymbia citriodora subsp. variegata]
MPNIRTLLMCSSVAFRLISLKVISSQFLPNNLNGASILGRIVRVDHVSNYKKKEEEDEEEEQRKRAERGVCRAFQRGECTRGAGCKFSHDEQRAANTGWGAKDDDGRWGHDKFDDPETGDKRSGGLSRNGLPESRARDGHKSMDSSFTAKEREADRQGEEHRKSRRHDPDDFEQRSRGKFDRGEDKNLRRDYNNDNVERGMKDQDRKEERTKRYDDDYEPRRREDYDRREEKRSRRHDDDDDAKPRSRDGYERKEESRSRKHESDSRSTYDREPSSRRRKER